VRFFVLLTLDMNKLDLLNKLNSINKGSLEKTLEIEFIDIGKDFLVAKMPVTSKVHQPDGVLHGGATAALAESVGSAASYFSVNNNNQIIRGTMISANHLKGISKGFVYAKASPIHKGRTTQLWKIEIKDEDENLISYCKLSTIIFDKK